MSGQRESGRWTDDLLDRLRQQGDPAADHIARAWLVEHHALDPRHAVATLARHETLPPEDRSPVVSAYLDDRPEWPTWADPERVRAAQDLFADVGPEYGTALFVGSLPAGYAGADGAKVLYRTGRLVTDPQRRVMETGQMILDVMTPGALDPGGRGWTAVRRVRLMHAAVRELVQSDRPAADGDPLLAEPWSTSAWGVPVNQEDLLGTLYTFTLVPFGVLERSGIDLTDEQVDAFLHAWCLVGHLLGIRDEHLPTDVDDAHASFDAIRRRNYRRSAEGEALTAALIDLIGRLVPGHLADGAGATAIRHYLGDDVADLLGVPPADWTHVLFAPVREALHLGERFGHHSTLARKLIATIGRHLWSGFLTVESRGERAPFTMPDHLASAWHLDRRHG